MVRLNFRESPPTRSQHEKARSTVRLSTSPGVLSLGVTSNGGPTDRPRRYGRDAARTIFRGSNEAHPASNDLRPHHQGYEAAERERSQAKRLTALAGVLAKRPAEERCSSRSDHRPALPRAGLPHNHVRPQKITRVAPCAESRRGILRRGAGLPVGSLSAPNGHLQERYDRQAHALKRRR
jgi:hypothetical protein